MKTPPEKTNNKRTKQSKTKGYKDEQDRGEIPLSRNDFKAYYII
jgi:hypothetical protein